MNILANDGISASAVEKLTRAGHAVFTDKVDQSLLADFINQNNIDCLLVRSATTARKELIDACPGLKLIGRGGVGMDNIDVEYARGKGLNVFNTPASSSGAVAELVMAHMFTLARFLHDSNRKMPANGSADFSKLKKDYGKGTELRGKTLGIIGMGRIGKSLASYALGAGMKVVACDQSSAPCSVSIDIHGYGSVEVQVPVKSLDEVLSESDYISLHVPKQKDRALIGSREFGLMKKSAVLINAARGGVVNESALKQALDSGTIRAAGLDVFDNEPTPDSDLLLSPNLSLTPHTGAATVEAQDRIGDELADIIIRSTQVRA
jgi:D-3-phosphoglycerate dehydrogenase / 2-oxoglutarate reductase